MKGTPLTQEELDSYKEQIVSALNQLTVPEPGEDAPHMLVIIKKNHHDTILSIAAGCSGFLAECQQAIMNTLVQNYGIPGVAAIFAGLRRQEEEKVKKNTVYTGKGGEA